MPKSSLSDVLLADEICAHVRAGHTGVLVVHAGAVTKTICLPPRGAVPASSTSEGDKLGQQLVRLGRISRAEFVAAFQRASATGERLGAALVGAGVLTDEEIGRLVVRQVQKLVLSLFAWTAGDMEFREFDTPVPPDLAVDLSTHRLVFEGSRTLTQVGRLEQSLGDTARRLRSASPPPFDINRVSFTPTEQAVLREADDRRRVCDVLDTQRPRDQVVRALYACLAGGLIETDASPRAEHPDLVEPELGTFRVAAIEADVTPTEDPSDRILRVFETLPRATHYEMLELSSDASPEDVEAAYRRLTAEASEDARTVLSDVRLDNALEAIRKRRLEAHETLADPRRRTAYDRSLARPGPSAHPRAAPQTADAHARALSLGLEARERLRQGQRDAAVTLLLEAVEADPQERSVRRLLAIALADHPTLARQAERHFRAALDLDPRDLDLRCRVSRYYRHMGMAVRARMNVEAALRVSPDYEPALKELEAVEALERRGRH